MVLIQGGYAVVPAGDGEQALALFRAAPTRFDLVLSDVLMPNCDGAELVARLRKINPDIPVLFMSGFTGGAPLHPVTLPVGAEVLEKPFTIDQLLTAVTSVVGK